MRTVTIIETAEELLELADNTREGKTYYLDPDEVTLVIDGNGPCLTLKDRIFDAYNFQLADSITEYDVFLEMAKKCNIDLHICKI